MKKITFIGKDNTDITRFDVRPAEAKTSLEEFRKAILDKVSGRLPVLSKDVSENCQNLLHYFFTECVEKEDIQSLFADTKWENSEKDLKKALYDPVEKRFGNYVGVISKNIKFRIDNKKFVHPEESNKSKSYELEVTVQIISRFDSMEKPYFLTSMLMKGNNLSVSDSDVPATSDGYFDFLLLALFKNRFRQAAQKGFYKTYHQFEGNDSRIKGSIDITRHIKLNVGLNNGKVAYRYRENSIVNYLNLLILAAYQYLRIKYFSLVRAAFDSDFELKNMLELIRNETEGYIYDNRTLISRNLTPVSHPYYSEYEEIRKICLKILRNEAMSFEQDDESAQGILYYIPDLWEEYLEDILSSKNYIVESQIKDFQIFNYADKPKKFRQSTRPDYVFYNKGDHEDDSFPFMILDAKFKPLWWERIKDKKSLGVQGENDKRSLLLDYDKCIRDMNSFNAHATGVIFPATATEDEMWDINEYENNARHNISNFNSIDHFYTFPIYIPDSAKCDNYTKWVEKFNESIGIGEEKGIGVSIRNIIEEELKFKKQIIEVEKNYIEKNRLKNEEQSDKGIAG